MKPDKKYAINIANILLNDIVFVIVYVVVVCYVA